MFARFRRQGWLAAILLALSPGMGGLALPLLNPCPIDAPQMVAQAAAGDHHAGHGGHGQAADQPGQSHQCSCVDCCSAPTRPEPPTIAIAAEVVTPPRRPSWPVVEGQAPALHILQLLPEATAPPPG